MGSPGGSAVGLHHDSRAFSEGDLRADPCGDCQSDSPADLHRDLQADLRRDSQEDSRGDLRGDFDGVLATSSRFRVPESGGSSTDWRMPIPDCRLSGGSGALVPDETDSPVLCLGSARTKRNPGLPRVSHAEACGCGPTRWSSACLRPEAACAPTAEIRPASNRASEFIRAVPDNLMQTGRPTTELKHRHQPAA